VRIPLNRVVAFAGPYIALASGGIAAWLVAKVNVIGIPGLDQANIATYIAAGGTLLLTAALTWLGHSKWLQGHHITIAADAEVQAAAVSTNSEPPSHALLGEPIAGQLGHVEVPHGDEEAAAVPEPDDIASDAEAIDYAVGSVRECLGSIASPPGDEQVLRPGDVRPAAEAEE
jgi:hypothetical protein